MELHKDWIAYICEKLNQNVLRFSDFHLGLVTNQPTIYLRMDHEGFEGREENHLGGSMIKKDLIDS